MAYSFNVFSGTLDQVGSSAVVFEGEVETFADLPEAVGDPAVGASYLVRTSTGVWLVNRRQAGIWIRKNNTGVRATDWEYGGDYPVTSVNGATGAVTITVPTASSTAPSPLGAAAIGSAATFARADHVHAMPSAADVGALQSAVSIEDFTFSGTLHTLPGRRNVQWAVTFVVSGGTRTLSLPTSAQVGDRLRVALTVPANTTLIVSKPNPGADVTIATVSAGTRFVYSAQVTQLVGSTPVWLSSGELSAAIGASPTSSTSTGTIGQFTFSDNFMYVCIADNTWRRVPIAAF